MGKVTALYRYPVKGFSPESLEAVDLMPGRTIPFDRAYAVENGPTGFDPAAPSYLPKIRFLMLMRMAAIARLKTRFDPATTVWRIGDETGGLLIEGRLSDPADRAAIEAWLADRFAGDLRGPPKILAGEGHSFSDVARKVLHLVNLASLRDLERHLGVTIDPLRFRANIHVDGWPAWSEFEMPGQRLQAGGVGLKAVKRTERCAATNVDRATGLRDLDLPKALMRLYGHTDFGIYVEVVEGGRVAVGASIGHPQAALDL